ncbi:MAG: thioredoxin domain-containing protein [Verrucomicrobiae bacterium]|nr:thioredoxin domain-containing protein [Verrucomicrobiae bacterium]
MKFSLFLSLTFVSGLLSTMDADETKAGDAKAHKYTNRLAKEKSPYLIQHQHNPVDWYPWGDEAFEKARKENKPIFLSIGYSTCHWCHVMERESFENEEIGKYLNEHFVSIKLDREERPDVDNIYMTAMQALQMGGGWPLNVFMTADRKPFFGGTYWPPESQGGRPGFKQVLEHIAELWETKQKEILENADQIAGELKKFTQKSAIAAGVAPVAITAMEVTAKQISSQYDAVNGGFSGAPKFPQPQMVSLVLQNAARNGDQAAIDQVLFTCRKMAAGGMYDQIGGGFARYSVDDKWLVPHFEKMLYDNAQLIDLYLDAYLISGDIQYANVARDVLRYVLRDMTNEGGGFYSAEDADSEGKEGKFYCWTKKELQELLTEDEFALVVTYYGVTDSGNFVDHSDPDPLPNLNVLSVIDLDRKLSGSEAGLLASARKKMFDRQAKRVRPHLDDKVLGSWNGMMLGAVSRAAIVLDDPSYLAAARKNLAFLKEKLWDPKTKTLYHRWRDGERDTTQILATYANVLAGVIDLYEATLEPEHLEFALAVNEQMIARFYDSEEGGFYQSAGTDDLLFRVKNDYDGAEPSGNSVAVGALLKLSAITDNSEFKAEALKTVNLFAERINEAGQALPMMLQSLPMLFGEPMRVVITGDPSSPEAHALVRAAQSTYRPDKVILGNAGPVEAFAKTLKSMDDKPTAYVCSGTACKPPTQDGATVRKHLAMAKSE